MSCMRRHTVECFGQSVALIAAWSLFPAFGKKLALVLTRLAFLMSFSTRMLARLFGMFRLVLPSVHT